MQGFCTTEEELVMIAVNVGKVTMKKGSCLYGAFQSQADFASPTSFTVIHEQLLVAR